MFCWWEQHRGCAILISTSTTRPGPGNVAIIPAALCPTCADGVNSPPGVVPQSQPDGAPPPLDSWPPLHTQVTQPTQTPGALGYPEEEREKQHAIGGMKSKCQRKAHTISLLPCWPGEQPDKPPSRNMAFGLWETRHLFRIRCGFKLPQPFHRPHQHPQELL